MKKVLKAMWYATLPFLIVILIAFTLIAFQTLFEWFGISDNLGVTIALFLIAWVAGFIFHLKR